MKLSSLGTRKTKVFQIVQGPIGGLMLLVCLSVSLSAGCGRSGASEGNLFRIPWPGEDGTYHVQNVSIPNFESPETLQGRFVKIFVDPYVNGGQLSGSTPVGRFVRNKDGVSIPSDYATLQATAIHAHYERLNIMDQAAGAKPTLPARIGIQANVVDKDGPVRDNAIYDGQLDALLIVPYSQDALPISMNGGILAHEHFHMIFQDLVMKKLGTAGKVESKKGQRLNVISRTSEWSDMMRKHDKTKDDEVGVGDTGGKPDPTEVYNLFYIRALNEGLADFWAWVYTGDVKFIGHSLPTQTEIRSMDKKTEQLASQDEIVSKITNDVGQFVGDDALVNRAYMLGTTYARLFHEITIEQTEKERPSLEERMSVARTLVTALPDFADAAVTAQNSKALISPNEILKSVYSKLEADSLQKPQSGTSKVCAVFARAAAPEAKSFTKSLPCVTATETVPPAKPSEEPTSKGAAK